MDLATLSLVVMLALAAVSADTVWHPTEVILQTSAAGKVDKVTIDETMIANIVRREIDRISATPTIMGTPRVELGKQGGIGMAIASATNMQSIAYALQAQAGFQPDQINLTLFSEDGTAKVLVTGSGRKRVGSFEQVVEQQKGEPVIALLHRAALVGMSRIDPYLTALSLMHRHASDQDFTDAETLIVFAKSQFAPTPVNPERSLFENLQGILALFRGNKDDAHSWFRVAAESNPDNPVAVLNLAFADLQLGHYQECAERMERLLRKPSLFNKMLISTGYVTWGAALLGVHNISGADQALEKATDANPDSAIAWEMWAEVKREKGDPAQADRLHQRAMAAAGSFENYAEVAALYFKLAWQENQPVMRSQFTNPTSVSQR